MMQSVFFILVAVLAAGSGIYLFRHLPKRWAIALTALFGLTALILYLMLGAPRMI